VPLDGSNRRVLTGMIDRLVCQQRYHNSARLCGMDALADDRANQLVSPNLPAFQVRGTDLVGVKDFLYRSPIDFSE